MKLYKITRPTHTIKAGECDSDDVEGVTQFAGSQADARKRLGLPPLDDVFRGETALPAKESDAAVTAVGMDFDLPRAAAGRPGKPGG